MKRLVLFHSLLPACWQTNSTWRLRRRRGGSSTSSVTPDLMPRSTQNWWGSAFADPDELQITERKQPWLLIWVVTLCIYLLVRALFLKYFKIRNINSCECFSGSRRDGQQRSVAVPTGDREDQELVFPQSDVGDEHWEKAGTQQQERGNLRTLHRD